MKICHFEAVYLRPPPWLPPPWLPPPNERPPPPPLWLPPPNERLPPPLLNERLLPEEWLPPPNERLGALLPLPNERLPEEWLPPPNERLGVLLLLPLPNERLPDELLPMLCVPEPREGEVTRPSEEGVRTLPREKVPLLGLLPLWLPTEPGVVWRVLLSRPPTEERLPGFTRWSLGVVTLLRLPTLPTLLRPLTLGLLPCEPPLPNPPLLRPLSRPWSRPLPR